MGRGFDPRRLHSTSHRDSSLAQTRPVAHRQRALFVLASKQRGFAFSPPSREAQPRDGVCPRNARNRAEIVSKSLNRVTGSYPVTRETSRLITGTYAESR